MLAYLEKWRRFSNKAYFTNLVFFFSPVYRAQFAKTVAEEKVQEPYVKKMIGMLSLLLAVSVGLFSFLRKYGECTPTAGNLQSEVDIQSLRPY